MHKWRDITHDDFGQFPNDETTVGSDTCESAAVNSHVDDSGCWHKDGR
jgi:hypothetical protein